MIARQAAVGEFTIFVLESFLSYILDVKLEIHNDTNQMDTFSLNS